MGDVVGLAVSRPAASHDKACDGPLWQRQALRELEVDLMERQLDVSHTVRDVSKAQRLVVTTLYAHGRHQPPSLSCNPMLARALASMPRPQPQPARLRREYSK